MMDWEQYEQFIISRQVIQMEGPELFEIFIQPIMFKTISFHHRASYIIKIQQDNHTHERSKAITPSFAPKRRSIDHRTGNIEGVRGSVDEEGIYQTDRFPIDYNEQSVKFTTGMWQQLYRPKSGPLELKIQLRRLDIEQIKNGVVHQISNPGQQLVAKKTLNLMLESPQNEFSNYSYRKMIFPTNQYISSLDLTIVIAKIGKSIDLNKICYDGDLALQNRGCMCMECCACCVVRQKITDPDAFLRVVYQESILDKLKNYKAMAQRLRSKIKDYKHKSKNVLKTNRKFEAIWVKRDIPDLDHIVVQGQHIQAGLLQSCMPIYNYESRDLTWNLCQHYECQIHELSQYILQQSWLIQINTRALFQRYIQLTCAMADNDCGKIVLHEMKRVRQFISIGGEGEQPGIEQPIQDEIFIQYKVNIEKKLKEMSNYSSQQESQPLLVVSGETAYGKSIDIDRTLTILVHGFRGSQFDLSKLKSYLNLFLKFSQFYAIKSLMQGQGTNASLSKLGELAGTQINQYLQKHKYIRHINVIGFSLGGVIARSMLKHMAVHKDKFNLLLTIGSPHLGMRDVESCLVRIGLLYMRRVAKVESIQDLNIERSSDQSRFMQDLANCEHINLFRWVILVGSHDDEYIPPYSSLCNYKGDNEQISTLCQAFSHQRKSLIRCSVKIEVEESLLDKLTKRRVHISLLQNDSLLRMLVLRFSNYFTHSDLL